MSKHFVTTLAEWLALPELIVPTDAQSGGKGVVYKILKVGFFGTTPAECEKKHLPTEPNLTGKCFLPTTFVQEKDGSQQLYKLPISLTEWATDFVASVHAGHKNPFPCDIEFNLREDCMYA